MIHLQAALRFKTSAIIARGEAGCASPKKQQRTLHPPGTSGNFLWTTKRREQDLAAIANVPAACLSDYLHDKLVSEEYADRIENAVANIIHVRTTFAPVKIALDDPQAFWKAVEPANRTRVCDDKWQGYEAGLRMKKEFNANDAAAD